MFGRPNAGIGNQLLSQSQHNRQTIAEYFSLLLALLHVWAKSWKELTMQLNLWLNDWMLCQTPSIPCFKSTYTHTRNDGNRKAKMKRSQEKKLDPDGENKATYWVHCNRHTKYFPSIRNSSGWMQFCSHHMFVKRLPIAFVFWAKSNKANAMPMLQFKTEIETRQCYKRVKYGLVDFLLCLYILRDSMLTICVHICW